MEAIGIIEREHRNFMAVLKCLENAVNDVAWRDREPDFPLIHSILDYVETFMDRYHHHNERDLLFNALDRRCPDAGELLQQMDVEHRDGTMLLGEFKAALDTYEKENHEAFEAFQDAVYKYIGFERTHCQKEEHRVIPLVAGTSDRI